MRRKYIDIISAIGKRANIINNMLPYELFDLLKEQTNCNIDASLCYDSSGLTSSYIKGNENIFEVQKYINSVYPIAVITPGIQYDLKNYNQYLMYLLSNGAKAILLNTEMNLFAYNKQTFDKIFLFCQQYNIPIIFNYSSVYNNLGVLTELAVEYKNLNIILYNINWSFWKEIFSYMESNPNLYITFPSFQKTNIIEIMCERFGAHRLLYSSNYPYTSPGAMKAMIEYANISEKEKDMISYKNAERLFSLNVPLRTFAESEDDMINILNSGGNLSKYKIIDAHSHLIGDDSININDMCNNIDCDAIINSMDRIGISKSLFSPIEGLFLDGITGNNISKNCVNKYANRLWGYVTVNPHYKEDIDFAIFNLNNNSFIGLKLYPSKNMCEYTDKKYESVFEKTIQENKIFLCHDSIESTRKLAEKYPNLKILLAHSAKSFEYAEGAKQLSEEFINIYFEICNSKLPYKVLEFLVENIGDDRIIFGSDMGLLNQSSAIGYVGYSSLSESQKIKILNKNILRFLKKEI